MILHGSGRAYPLAPWPVLASYLTAVTEPKCHLQTSTDELSIAGSYHEPTG